MKKLLVLLLFPTIALASDCDRVGLYAFAVYNCPQFNSGCDLSIPLCEQEQCKKWAYLDSRCYVGVPLYQCNEWDCPLPYEKVFREPISGEEHKLRDDDETIDNHYRSARSQISPKLEARSKIVKTKKKKSSKK